MKKSLLLLGITALLLGCAKNAKTIEEKSGLAIQNIDKSVKPGDDFYGYANGNWLKTAKPYPGTPYNGNLIEMNFRTENQIGEILKEVVNEKNLSPNSPKGQIQAFYKSYVDTITRNSLGVKPIKKDLDAILAVKTKSELATLMGSPILPSMWSQMVFLDSKNTKRYLPILGQRALGMGGIEYYLNNTGPNPAIREAYLGYIEKLFTYAGINDPAARAKTCLSMEMTLAKVYWTKTQMRNPDKMYHLMTMEELMAYAPGFDWKAYWDAKIGGGLTVVNVNTDTAVQAVAKIFQEASIEDLKSLTAFYFLDSSGKYLSSNFERANFEFFDKTLKGVATQRPFEERVKGVANLFLPWQLGTLYAEKYYTKEVKEQAELLVGYMKKAILKRLQSNEWMDEATKKEAINKFNNIHWKIGAPEKYNDLSSLKFKEDDFVGNLRQIAYWSAKDDMVKLKETKREWEWLLPPQVVNAYYQPEMNDAVIPIGILQSPNFDPKADAAANFGGILSIVGHEVGHGFDDKGSKSDANGLLRNWWTEASRIEFENRANALVEQYNQFEPLKGIHVNGRLTLGENIGDLGGVAIAYSAYKDYVAEHQGGKAPVIDGFTGDQRFFLANAQVWSWYSTEDYIRYASVVDIHSPAKFRVNGVVRNMDAWYKAFNVKEGDLLFLPADKRVRIW